MLEAVVGSPVLEMVKVVGPPAFSLMAEGCVVVLMVVVGGWIVVPKSMVGLLSVCA